MNRPRTSIIATVFIAAATTILAAVHYGASQTTDPVIKITARRFEFSPSLIHLKRSVPVVLEFTTLDRRHGFKSEALGLHAEIRPGETSRVRVAPAKAGTFPFHCDVFCGEGHEDMTGTIVVE
jgi:cytochrome c oxidase subunit II